MNSSEPSAFPDVPNYQDESRRSSGEGGKPDLKVTPKPVAEADVIAEAEKQFNSVCVFNSTPVEAFKKVVSHARQLEKRLGEYSGWSPHQFLGLMAEHKKLQKKHVELDTRRYNGEVACQAAGQLNKTLEERCKELTQRIAELERERDEAVKDRAKVFSANEQVLYENGQLKIRIAELEKSFDLKTRADALCLKIYDRAIAERDSLQRMIDSAVKGCVRKKDFEHFKNWGNATIAVSTITAFQHGTGFAEDLLELFILPAPAQDAKAEVQE